MSKLRIVILILFFIVAFSSHAQHVSVQAKLDSNTIKIGDQVRLKLQIAYPAKTIIAWPQLNDSLSKHIEIIQKSKIDTLSKKDAEEITLSQTCTITSFDSGSFYVPQVSFKFKNLGDTAYFEALTDSLLLTVNTIAVDTTRAIKDIKGPMSVPWTFREMLPYILGAILLVAIVWLVIYYLRKKKRGESLIAFSKPKLPPHEEALRALDALRNKKLWQNNMVKEYYTELTEIIRRYIERRYGVLALEMITDEIISALKWFDMKESVRKNLNQLLFLADLVKFAKANPLPNEHDQFILIAYEFVNETKISESLAVTAVQKPVQESLSDKTQEGGNSNVV